MCHEKRMNLTTVRSSYKNNIFNVQHNMKLLELLFTYGIPELITRTCRLCLFLKTRYKHRKI